MKAEDVVTALSGVAAILAPLAERIRTYDENAYQMLCRHITETSDMAMLVQLHAQKEPTQ